MKTCIAFMFSVLALPAFAAVTDTGSSGMMVSQAQPVRNAQNLTDFSLAYSSILKGSSYAGVGLMKEWDNGYALGVRGFMPLTFDKDTNVYMGQIALRMMLLNESNQIYVEPEYTQGFYNHVGQNTGYFNMFGAVVGFNHPFNKNFTLGASLGVDYALQTVTEQRLTDTHTFYNKISVVGGYYF